MSRSRQTQSSLFREAANVRIAGYKQACEDLKTRYTSTVETIKKILDTRLRIIISTTNNSDEVKDLLALLSECISKLYRCKNDSSSLTRQLESEASNLADYARCTKQTFEQLPDVQEITVIKSGTSRYIDALDGWMRRLRSAYAENDLARVVLAFRGLRVAIGEIS